MRTAVPRHSGGVQYNMFTARRTAKTAMAEGSGKR